MPIILIWWIWIKHNKYNRCNDTNTIHINTTKMLLWILKVKLNTFWGKMVFFIQILTVPFKKKYIMRCWGINHINVTTFLSELFSLINLLLLTIIHQNKTFKIKTMQKRLRHNYKIVQLVTDYWRIIIIHPLLNRMQNTQEHS